MKYRHFEYGGFQSVLHMCTRSGLQGKLFGDADVIRHIGSPPAPQPEYLADRIDDICEVYAGLADDESRECFLGIIKSIIAGQPGYRTVAPYPEYFHPEVSVREGDVIIEGGLADGLTTECFARIVGEKGKVYGFEPLSRYFEESSARLAEFENVTLEKLGLWSGPAAFYIADNGGGSRMASEQRGYAEECHSIDIDSYMQGRGKCDLIKLDIEGAELECLYGAAKTIASDRPKLQVCVYHEYSHYLDIPLWLMRNFQFYRFYLGHHGAWIWETVLYCLP